MTDGRGRRLPYDALVIAVGGCPRPALPGATTFSGAIDAPAVKRALDAAAELGRPRLAFTMPSRSTWALPLYELSIMAAVELRDRGVTGAELTVVTPELEPLWAFGVAAGEAVAELLGERGIGLRTGARPVAVSPGWLEVTPGLGVAADHVIALPALEGPRISGLPCDDGGFIPVDAHGRVSGLRDVYAAGDATTFPLKQGGLATQQADAVAEGLAAELGAPVRPSPFRPVLRGLLLTGGAPLYLRAELDASGAPSPGAATARRVGRRLVGEVSTRAVVASRQDRRSLSRAAAGHRQAGRARGRAADGSHRPLVRSGPETDREAALDLALLVAEEDAATGDFAQAVQAVDAAGALAGGLLAAEYQAKRAAWSAASQPSGVENLARD